MLLLKWVTNIPIVAIFHLYESLGTVGEPINPEAWMWYHKVIGGERCPIVDTWWQTETGGFMLTPLPGATPTKPGSATFPFPGIIADVVDLEGNPVRCQSRRLLNYQISLAEYDADSL